MSKKPLKSIVLINLMLLPLIIGVALFFLLRGCSDNRSAAHLVYEVDGKKYIYHFNAFFLNNALERGETPSLAPEVYLYNLRDVFYLDPGHIEPIVDLLSGNITLIDAPEKSFEGYFVSGDYGFMKKDRRNESTDRIGETKSVNHITLSKPNADNNLQIKWVSQPDLEAIKNTEIKRVRKVHNPYPGKTLTNYPRTVLIPLDLLLSFYENDFDLKYDSKDAVLYFSRN